MFDFLRRRFVVWKADWPTSFGRRIALSEHLPKFDRATWERHRTDTLRAARAELAGRLALVDAELARRDRQPV